MSATGVSSPPAHTVGAEIGGQRRSASPEQIRDELIDAAAAYAPDIGDLIRLYYRHMPAEEIVGDDPVDLVGAVRSHQQLARPRMPGRPAVRPFHPTTTQAGGSRQ